MKCKFHAMKYSFLWSAVWSGADYDSFSVVVMRYSAVEENRFRIFYYICVLEMMFQWDFL